MECTEVLTVNLRGVKLEIDNTGDLAKLIRNKVPSGPYSEIYLNRNPQLFHSIVDYFLSGELHVPAGACGRHFEQELEFWGMEASMVQPCCQGRLREARDMMQAYDKIRAISKTLDSDVIAHKFRGGRVWRFLERPNSSFPAKVDR